MSEQARKHSTRMHTLCMYELCACLHMHTLRMYAYECMRMRMYAHAHAWHMLTYGYAQHTHMCIRYACTHICIRSHTHVCIRYACTRYVHACLLHA